MPHGGISWKSVEVIGHMNPVEVFVSIYKRIYLRSFASDFQNILS